MLNFFFQFCISLIQTVRCMQKTKKPKKNLFLFLANRKKLANWRWPLWQYPWSFRSKQKRIARIALLLYSVNLISVRLFHMRWTLSFMTFEHPLHTNTNTKFKLKILNFLYWNRILYFLLASGKLSFKMEIQFLSILVCLFDLKILRILKWYLSFRIYIKWIF